MTRLSLSLALVLLSLALSLPVAAERRRSVSPPRSGCAFALTASYIAPVPAEGLQGVISVAANPSACTSWIAYSSVDWITIQQVPGQARISVAPNPTELPRVAVLTIAGIRHEVVQDGAPPPPTLITNLLVNPGFEADLSGWDWPAHLPNGSGNAAWTSLDANGSITSGSLRLRNTQTGHAFQRQQCVKVAGNKRHTFGADVLMTNPSAGGAVIGVYAYLNDSCTDMYAKEYPKQILRQTNANQWTTFSYTFVTEGRTESVLFLLAGGALSQPPFDVWFDDIVLRPEP